VIRWSVGDNVVEVSHTDNRIGIASRQLPLLIASNQVSPVVLLQ
jgi:hypothetical protein